MDNCDSHGRSSSACLKSYSRNIFQTRSGIGTERKRTDAYMPFWPALECI